MFIKDIFKLENNQIDINWNLSVDNIKSIFDNDNREYTFASRTFSFKIPSEYLDYYCKIYYKKNCKKIKYINYSIISKVSISDTMNILKENICSVLGEPKLITNIENISLMSDKALEYDKYPKLIWQTEFLSVVLSLFERFGFYWTVYICSEKKYINDL